MWVVQYLAKNGFYVIIDQHTEDQTASNLANTVNYWKDLVTKICADKDAAKMLIVDVLNEPDARGWGWNRMTVRERNRIVREGVGLEQDDGEREKQGSQGGGGAGTG